jgi:hypothetical protein
MREKLRVHLDDVMKEMATHVEAIVDTEASNARNVSLMDGIVRINAARGIDDPVVYFVVVRDNVTCDECIKLHLLKDKRTPRVWKLSEVGQGYHKRGDDHPKIGGLHPHCRCTMVTLLPGFGFKAAAPWASSRRATTSSRSSARLAVATNVVSFFGLASDPAGAPRHHAAAVRGTASVNFCARPLHTSEPASERSAHHPVWPLMPQRSCARDDLASSSRAGVVDASPACSSSRCPRSRDRSSTVGSLITVPPPRLVLVGHQRATLHRSLDDRACPGAEPR